MAGRQPHLYACRHCNHRRRLPFARTLISADTVEALTAPIIRIRPPSANSISTVPAGSEDAVGGGRAAISSSGAIATGWNAAGIGARSQSCCRQRNSWLEWMPASRATSEATAPGASAAATIRSFSARDHRRRRRTDVITSTCCLVIVLVLGLALGLAAYAQSRKTAFTGGLRPGHRHLKHTTAGPVGEAIYGGATDGNRAGNPPSSARSTNMLVGVGAKGLTSALPPKAVVRADIAGRRRCAIAGIPSPDARVGQLCALASACWMI